MKAATRPALDVSRLPSFAFGARDPLWWGVVGMMLIEGTMFALSFASYVYLRGNFEVFPPTGMSPVAFRWAVAGQLCLAVSVPCMWWTMRASKRSDLRAMRRGLLLAAIPSYAFVVTRVMELIYLPFRWDDHAYGSIFWFIASMHSLHGLLGSSEDVALMAVLFRGPVEKKFLVDVHTNGFYWFFVVISGALTFALLYLDPATLRTLP
jgi:cytochrome c oxidase subunit III